MKNLVSDVDAKVEEFHSKFSDLRLALQGLAIVQTEIAVFRVLETVENLSSYFVLPLRLSSDRYISCMQVRK
jgi:hypothetical protein